MDDCLRDEACVFPDDLSAFSVVEPLGGGTRSTYRLTNPATFQSLVLKHGAHLDAIRIEILCNAAYRSLGVRVPNIKIYDTVSLEIARKLELAGMSGIFQVSEYIDADKDADRELIVNAAQKDFMAHVLLGNIDIAKEDNYVVSKTGDVYFVDAGANFVFRAKGEHRTESRLLVSELFSLRDEKINLDAHSWFSLLSDEQITAQVVKIAERRLILEKYIWSVAQVLQLSDELCNMFLECIADRLDYLLTLFCKEQQPFAKIDKKASEQHTAAGVLTYTYLYNKPYILLAKRAKHEWWSNFGGKSDYDDFYLYETAIREVAEESSFLIEYSAHELLNSPCHDLISVQASGDVFVYRMYITHHHYINIRQFIDGIDHEHTAYQWVPLSSLINGLRFSAREIHEGEETISFSAVTRAHPIKREHIILYPPFYRMLCQPCVFKNLERLLAGKKLLQTHTQGDHREMILPLIKRPMTSPALMKTQISDTLLNHAKVISMLKKRNKPKINAMFHKRVSLSQSELYLKIMLGDEYQQDDLSQNIRCFFEKHFISDEMKKLNKNQREELVGLCAKLISNEKHHNQKQLFFYHACDSKVAFLYSFYRLLYQSLYVNYYWPVFRADKDHFENFQSIGEFIHYYSNGGKEDIHNNSQNYHECALSSNVFLFGNHEQTTSCSIDIMLRNQTNRDLDLVFVLLKLLQPFSVSDHEISQLLMLYNAHEKALGGSLFQIGVPKDMVGAVSYPAGSLGIMNQYDGSKNLCFILDKLAADCEHDNDNQSNREGIYQYVKQLQARLFLPPNQQVSTMSVHWPAQEEKGHQRYFSELQAIVDRILHAIFRHINEKNMTKLDVKSPLFHLLSTTYTQNQLSLQKGSMTCLLNAILNHQNWFIKDLFSIYPQLKYKSMYVGYDNYLDNNENTLSLMTPLEMMIKKSTFAESFLQECFGKCWWHDAKLIDALSVNHVDDLYLILKKMPVAARFEYVTKHADVIVSCADIIKIIDFLPQKYTLKFVEQHQHHIETDNQLYDILVALPAKFRFVFAQGYQDKIQYIYQLREILRVLPTESRLSLAKNVRRLINNSYDAQYIMRVLKDEDKLSYVLSIVDSVILSQADMVSVVKLLPSADRIRFAMCFQGTNISYQCFITIFTFLRAEDRLEYAFNMFKKYSYSHLHVISVIEKLQISDRFDFALHYAKPNTTEQLVAIVNYLADEKREEFFCKFKHLIRTQQDLAWVLLTLAYPAAYSFVSEFAIRMTDFTLFLLTLLYIEPSDQLAFAIRYYADVQHKEFTLHDVLQVLPKEARLDCAIYFKQEVKSCRDLGRVLEVLSPIEQDAFQQLFPHFVEGSSVSAGDENNVSSLGLFNRHDSIVKDTQAASNSQVVTQNNDATTALVAGIAGRL